ncbi:MAG: ABC transporter permease subunit [Clostridiales Family XIII bacterium]|jgi:ABC-type spermidine/putrescine transport system permease subunit II|nr:ABC transporter permease subunit [Clostridiales Family XIII bacterium]
MRMGARARTAILALAAAALLLPLAPLLMWSAATYWRWPAAVPEFDGGYWPRLLADGRILPALGNSLILSASVALLSLALAFFAAKALGTRNFRGKRLVELLLLVPAFIPQIAVVFGMQAVFMRLGLYSNFAGLLTAHLVFYVPYATLLLSAVFEGYDASLEEQARTLGAGRLRTALHVTLPAVRSGIIVTGVFCFIGSWSVYLLNNVIGDPRFKTLPSVIFPLVSVGNNSYSTMAAAVIVYILPVLAALALASRALAPEASPGIVRNRGLV